MCVDRSEALFEALTDEVSDAIERERFIESFIYDLIGNLVQYRLDAGWSQRMIAEALEVSPHWMQRWEDGELAMTLAPIAQYAFALGMAVNLRLAPIDSEPEVTFGGVEVF
jgi:DNA-binding XRE family transcriptional regulator